MASEAQRIMNLSLTKIVSSRGKRGGPRLHRNLLLASVLFRARDLYAAEMAGLVVFQNGYVYDRNSPLPVDTPPDMPDPVDSTDDDNLIPNHRIQETVGVVVLNPVSSRDPSPSNISDESPRVDVDMEKENIRPKDLNNTTATDSTTPIKRAKRNRKSLPNRKRKFTETEQAVISISEPTDSPKPTKLRCEDNAISLECSELPTTLTDWCVDHTSMAAESQINRDMSSAINHDTNSAVAYSSHAYDDYDDDEDDDESKYNDINPYQRHVNSAVSDSISLLLSHPVLVSF